MPRGKPTSKKAGYDKATAKCMHCNKSYHAVEDCWFLHTKNAKESWLARNPVSHTEQPINLMTIGTLPFDKLVEPTTSTPQNSQPSQNSLVEEEAKFPLTPDTWPAETLVSPTIDPSVLDFYENSEPS